MQDLRNSEEKRNSALWQRKVPM